MFFIKKCFTNSNDKKVIIEKEKLFFAWQLESDRNNTVQKAYEIKLFDIKKELIWESGKVESSKSINVYYDEQELQSRNEYCWKVTVWNNYDEVAESELNYFEIGLNTEDWEAKRIEANMPIKSKKEDFNFGKIFSYRINPLVLDKTKGLIRFLLSFIAAFFSSMQQGLINMLVNDIIDYVMLKDGVSLNGTISAIKGFSYKFGSTVTNTTVLAVLAVTGYVAGAIGHQLVYPIEKYYPEIEEMKSKMQA